MRNAKYWIAALALMLSAGAVNAQPYPSRVIRIVVPFPPGNASDLATRTIGEPLSRRLGQPRVIDNRPGASGTIGADALAKAVPYGHNRLGTPSGCGVTPWAFKKLP